MRAKFAEMGHGANERSAGLSRQAPAEQAGAQTASTALMLLVAGLFAGSALISLSLLWFALKGIQWLLYGWLLYGH